MKITIMSNSIAAEPRAAEVVEAAVVAWEGS